MLAIKVEGLSKEYVLGGEAGKQRTFREMLMGAVTEPIKRLKRLQGSSEEQERFWALKDINFTVNEGEVVGIIGVNGAGKSTLLKVLSRITAPTKGQIQYKGKIASLLEVGTGFHPELSGRENIFINGAILGMTKSEIRKRFDEIVEFAGIEKFLDTPVKRYSSGMYVRLAFAVAAHMDPDILIVDEVLAVGDASFQNKCIRKMEDVSREGRTVLFVSHNMASIKSMCSRAIQLCEGSMVADGSASVVVGAYLQGIVNTGVDTFHFSASEHRVGSGFSISSLQFIRPSNQNIYMFGDRIEIRLGIRCVEHISDARIGIAIVSEGQRICTITSPAYDFNVTDIEYITCWVPECVLLPGTYTLILGAHRGNNGAALDWVTTEIPLIISDVPADGVQAVPEKSWGVVLLPNKWERT